MEFLKQLINGLSIGSVYALVALGYTMVYGIVKLINFAHGDIIMVGSYVVLLSMRQLGLPFWLSIIISMVFCAVAGVLIERIAYRPLRSRGKDSFLSKLFGKKAKSSSAPPRISALITAIGVSLFIQNSFALIFTATPRPFPNAVSGMLSFNGLKIEKVTVLAIVTSISLMILLNIFVKGTKMGKAMRAVSEYEVASTLMGINSNVTISVTFAIGSALAAVGGALYSVAYPMVDPFMGATFGLKAFIAAVFGGIGILPGAMLGGFLMGVSESLTKGYLTSKLSDAVVFAILIIVLLIKPSGILGIHVKEKV